MWNSLPFVSSQEHRELILWVIKGPFGFVPSAAGLTSSFELVNSLTAVQIDSLFTAIEEVKYRQKLSH